MKWKKGVSVTRDGGVFVCYSGKKKEVPEEDILIVDLMGNGITDDDMLIREVARSEENEVINAEFRLAQFVEDYGEFLEKAEPSPLYE
ncbi:MAG: hypothetical protein K6D02_05255 [Lachnospiraceae bacterium]|nr:hypothetical protein [Lachnospiraceae bacterium]